MINKLVDKIKKQNAPVVVGLDPMMKFVPKHLQDAAFKEYGETLEGAAEAIWQFNKAIIDNIYDIVPAVKPQVAMYEQFGIPGMIAFKKTVDYCHEKDMVVITSVGLVGKVTKASSNFSIVQTILNENIAVAAMVESTNETTGILQGINDNKNKNLTQLSNIPMDSAIKEGDIILTSGLGSMYPKGIRIGEVTSVEVDNVGIMKKAVVKPYVDFNKLQELFVIVPKEKVDIGE